MSVTPEMKLDLADNQALDDVLEQGVGYLNKAIKQHFVLDDSLPHEVDRQRASIAGMKRMLLYIAKKSGKTLNLSEEEETE